MKNLISIFLKTSKYKKSNATPAMSVPVAFIDERREKISTK